MAATLAELAALAGAVLEGTGGRRVVGVDTLQDAAPDHVSFYANRLYRRQLEHTRAAAVILRPADRPGCPVDALVTDNPYLAYARIATYLSPRPTPAPGIHPSAVVEDGASVAASASIGAHSVVEAGAVVADDVVVGPNCVVGRDVRIGCGTRLVASVTLCDGTEVGERCLLQPGVVIGSDGFGMANDGGTWVRVPQLGRVRIGNDVDVGANTTVDRGSIRDTVIADGVKLDNLIQVAHNVEVGEHTAMAACTGVSGSTRIGRRCTLAGAVGVVGHVEIADDVHVSGMSMVSRSIREAGVYTGSIPAMPHDEWRRNFARLKQLDNMARRLRALEARLAGTGPTPDDD